MILEVAKKRKEKRRERKRGKTGGERFNGDPRVRC